MPTMVASKDLHLWTDLFCNITFLDKSRGFRDVFEVNPVLDASWSIVFFFLPPPFIKCCNTKLKTLY